MAQRPEVRSLLASDDPAAQLEGFGAIAVQVNERLGDLYRILLNAADADPEAATQLQELTQQRQQGQRAIARSLARRGALRSGLRERDAADLVHALLSPELYRLLVNDRRWSPERYAAWLTATRSEERRVGKECVSTCRSRGSQYT